MPINFNSGDSIGLTKAPRNIIVGDNTGGCPTSGRTNPLMSLSFTVASKSIVVIQGEIIRRNAQISRCDTTLQGPGYPNTVSNKYEGTSVILDYLLDYNDDLDNEWGNHCFNWIGYVDAGTHTFSLNAQLDSGCINFFGCGSGWGQMNAIIFE